MNAENELLDYFDNSSSLIYGIGNVGRQDDGLGWAFIDWLEQTGTCNAAERVRFYQLNLEDADLISHYKRVLFVDALKDGGRDAFRFYRAVPKMDFSFTSHAMSIETILATCGQCFGTMPEVYVLAVRGFEWELQVGLSDAAQVNLDSAISHMTGGLTRQARLPERAASCR